MHGHYTVRRLDLVLHDIEVLRIRHSAQCIMFGDDCIPPATLKALARRLLETDIPISWQCEARLDRALTADLLSELGRSGCRNLTFGLESYAPRVLSLMNKGIRHAQIRQILDDCRRAGIAFNLQLFFGFPGETEAEAHTTVRFVLDEMHGAATCSFGSFSLLRGSGLARQPEVFGIRTLEPAKGDLSVQLDYVPVPLYVPEIRKLLRCEILARVKYRYLGFSLDAHSLCFLHQAGWSRMAQDYYRDSPSKLDNGVHPHPPGANGRLTRRGKQTIYVFPRTNTAANQGEASREGEGGERPIVYDYDLDETFEVSRLAAWVLKNLEVPKSAAELARRVAETADNHAEARHLATEVYRIIEELVAKGLVVKASAPDFAIPEQEQPPMRPGRTHGA
jgi:hypothetical protein